MKKRLLFLLFILVNASSFAQKAADTISLYFSNDSHTPTLKHIAIIDSITSLEQAYFRSIDVIGYTNNIGSDKHNLLLSQKRATHIANNIHQHNLGKVHWEGELPSKSIKNRKVDLIINYQELTAVEEIIEIEDFKESTTLSISENNLSATISETKVEGNLYKDFNSKVSQLQVGEKMKLKNIVFGGGTDILQEISYFSLYKLLRYLQRNPNVKINIQGHICCLSSKGSKSHEGVNIRTGKRNLSKARAKQVYKFLKKNGIKKSRMTYEGLANQFPTGKKDIYLDRRVEIEIVSK